MRIEHVAIWVNDLERSREFYTTTFGAVSGERYENPAKRFSSYFLSFPGDGARLELMAKPGLNKSEADALGYAHLAISVGSERAVNKLTERLRANGYSIIDGPRRTGDGYYEAVVLDPDGNRVEITA